MDKKEALNKIKTLEKELASLKVIVSKPETIFDVTTYSKVCTKLKESQIIEEYFNNFPKEDRKKLAAFAKIKQLERFYNQGWIPNWSNTSEYKYYPYFSLSSGGCLWFNGSLSYDSGFSELCGVYKTSEISNFVGKTYIDIYKDLM